MADKQYYYTSTNRMILYKRGSVNPKPYYLYNGDYFKSERFWKDSTGNPYVSSVSHLLNEVQPTDHEHNKLYSKIRQAVLGSQGELLTSIMEWKESLEMISQRALQLAAAYSALRKGNFQKAGKLLQMDGHQAKIARDRGSPLGGKSPRFSPTSAWLEYWMGWAPLVGDIEHAFDVISREPRLMYQTFSVGTMVNRVPEKFIYRDTYETYETTVTHSGKFSAYGKFQVTNHNLFAANQLGLLNPAKTAWQLIPFSFIADWFMNVGTVLGGLTDFVGLRIFDTGYAKYVEVNATGQRTAKEYDSVNSTYGNQLWNYYVSNSTGVGRYWVRKPGPIQAPRIEVAMLDKLSLTRAATSISLLVEIFLKK